MPPNTSNFDGSSQRIPKEVLADKELLEDDYQRSDYSDEDKLSLDDNFHLSDHYDDDSDHPELKISLSQMWEDTRNLDWSKVLWDMVFCMVGFHIFVLVGVYQALTLQASPWSWVFAFFASYAGGLGITMGTHRLWTHKAFKAVLPVRVALMLMNSLAFQESIYLWCQNHRVHHKWSDTDRDFTNSRRGFFFAHCGWKMYQTHPEVIKGRKLIDVSDLLADPVVRFQHQYYYYISLLVCFMLPTFVPYYLWGESLWVAFCCCACLRLAITMHSTWCINSVAHLYGYKPYDKSQHAFENKYLGPFALGEGWHNFHHTFPRDYRASEMDGWGMNFTTKAIEALSRAGLIYDLVSLDEDHIARRTNRTGSAELRKAANEGTLYKLDKRKYTKFY